MAVAFPAAKTNISDEGAHRGDTTTTLVSSHDRSPMEWARREAEDDHGPPPDSGITLGPWTAVGWPVGNGQMIFQPDDHQLKFFHLAADGTDVTATLSDPTNVGKLLVVADATGRSTLRIGGSEPGGDVIGVFGVIESTGAAWVDGNVYQVTIEG